MPSIIREIATPDASMSITTALNDAVATLHQPAPIAKERRSAGDQDGVPATAAPYAESCCPIS
jgi:hypothetical protein